VAPRGRPQGRSRGRARGPGAASRSRGRHPKRCCPEGCSKSSRSSQDGSNRPRRARSSFRSSHPRFRGRLGPRPLSCTVEPRGRSRSIASISPMRDTGPTRRSGLGRSRTDSIRSRRTCRKTLERYARSWQAATLLSCGARFSCTRSSVRPSLCGTTGRTAARSEGATVLTSRRGPFSVEPSAGCRR